MPPVIVLSILPSFSPKQILSTTKEFISIGVVGWYTVSEKVVGQLLASVTVTK